MSSSNLSKKELINEYNSKIPHYQKLLVLVESTICDVAKENALKLHSVRGRIKTFESFLAKIDRKQYDNPWRQCEDIAGVKIICLFEDQVPKLVEILRQSLQVIESKKKKKHTDQFSYTAHHMIVQHKDIPKEFVCEIQIKTILQDAWSEMEHYVNYKQLSLDDKTQRKVNALSALFEVAEDQFKEIYESYQKLQAPQENTDLKISAAAIYQYATKEFSWAWKYEPDRAILDQKDEYEQIAQIAQGKGVTKMRQLIQLIDQKIPSIIAQDKLRTRDILNSPSQWPKLYERVKITGHFNSPAILIKRCLE